MRRYFIDNLRWLAVLFLFPYHCCMVYNDFGESFYVKGAEAALAGRFIVAFWPWFMPLLFTIAGISAAYALAAKGTRAYAKERVMRLLIPLLFGLLLLVPMQTYIAEVFHNGYTGGYLRQYILFFTKPTDLSGYQGGFTPAHLWFLLYLFLISMITLPLLHWYSRSKKRLPLDKLPLVALLALFIVPVFTQMILDISGKSVGEYLTYFLFGYFILSDEHVQDKLLRFRFLLLGLALSGMIVCVLWHSAIEAYSTVLYELLYAFYAWVTILAILRLGKRYLDFSNAGTAYLSKAFFPLYIFHQQWLVLAAYFALQWFSAIPLQMAFILLASAALSFLNYELFRRIPLTRFMFGIKR